MVILITNNKKESFEIFFNFIKCKLSSDPQAGLLSAQFRVRD